MNYSGHTSFTFNVQRYLDSDTGIYYHPDNKPEFLSEKDYKLVPLFIKGHSFFTIGRTSGPPDLCYPDEGETNIESITGPDNVSWEDKLSDEEIESVLSEIDSKVQDDYHWYDDDDDDYDYEFDTDYY